MSEQTLKLWDDERIRLLKYRWEAEDRYRAFVAAGLKDYPTVTLPKAGVCAVEAPCCGNQVWHVGPFLHKCSFCRKYYFVLGVNSDD